MSTNKLAQVIRKIVREEVRKEVRQVLNEQSKPKNVTKKEFKSGLQHALGLTDSVERASRRPKPSTQYTKNKMLNEILNETAGELSAGNTSRLAPEAGGYPTMGEQTFTSNNAQTFDRNSLASKLGYGEQSGAPSIQEMVPRTDVRGVATQTTEVDPAVAKALTRDYSELVKKFKK
jgi:hypothetical protein